MFLLLALVDRIVPTWYFQFLMLFQAVELVFEIILLYEHKDINTKVSIYQTNIGQIFLLLTVEEYRKVSTFLDF
jgi:hypothetical protein